jgi:hypothetical protein
MVPRAVRPRIKHEKPMRKVIVGAMVSMDGVMQAPGGPLTVPVVLGGGKKLFADGSAPHSFKLTSSRVSSTGVYSATTSATVRSRSSTARSIHPASVRSPVRSG